MIGVLLILILIAVHHGVQAAVAAMLGLRLAGVARIEGGPRPSVIRRFLVILSGPSTFLVVAIAVVFATTLTRGAPAGLRPVVATISPDGAAAGVLQPGDELLAVDGQPLLSGLTDFRDAVQRRAGKPVRVSLLRGERPLDVTLAPKSKDGVFLVGVTIQQQEYREPVAPGRAAGLAARYPFDTSLRVVRGVLVLFTGRSSADASGPVAITSVIARAVGDRSLGERLADEVPFWSVCLGLIFLLPLPMLDGGRLIYLMWSALFRRPVRAAAE